MIKSLNILYEAKDFLVIDKPNGISVHPAKMDSKEKTLINLFIDKIDKNVGDPLRPGIVHRLDKDTSGVMIIARTNKGYDYFVDQFKQHKIKKVYLALVKGILEFKEGIIDSPISRDLKNRKRMSVTSQRRGKMAISQYKVLKEYSFDNKTYVSLVEIAPETGRTHQIRVHFAAISHPIICDEVYGIRSFNKSFKEKFKLDRQFLHAHQVSFKDPLTKKLIKIKAELPEDLSLVLQSL